MCFYFPLSVCLFRYLNACVRARSRDCAFVLRKQSVHETKILKKGERRLADVINCLLKSAKNYKRFFVCVRARIVLLK